MELNFFMRELEGALIERGIPSDTAKKHVLTLKRTFTTDDLIVEDYVAGPQVKNIPSAV